MRIIRAELGADRVGDIGAAYAELRVVIAGSRITVDGKAGRQRGRVGTGAEHDIVATWRNPVRRRIQRAASGQRAARAREQRKRFKRGMIEQTDPAPGARRRCVDFLRLNAGPIERGKVDGVHGSRVAAGDHGRKPPRDDNVADAAFERGVAGSVFHIGVGFLRRDAEGAGARVPAVLAERVTRQIAAGSVAPRHALVRERVIVPGHAAQIDADLLAVICIEGDERFCDGRYRFSAIPVEIAVIGIGAADRLAGDPYHPAILRRNEDCIAAGGADGRAKRRYSRNRHIDLADLVVSGNSGRQRRRFGDRQCVLRDRWRVGGARGPLQGKHHRGG
jgi:hypothetical protein